LAKAATITVTTGNTCPCVTNSQDGVTPDSQWHRDNPGADACNDTGLISRVETTTNIKFAIWGLGAWTNIPKAKEILEQIGEIQKDDLIIIGTLDTDNNDFEDISGKSEYHDWITYDSNKYVIRDVWDLAGVGDMARLVRKEN
jgi:hypothetical protein